MVSKKMIWQVLRFEVSESEFYNRKLDQTYALTLYPDLYLNSTLMTKAYEKVVSKEISLTYFFDWTSFYQLALEATKSMLKGQSIKFDITLVIKDLYQAHHLKWEQQEQGYSDEVFHQNLQRIVKDVERHIMNCGKPWNQKTYSQEEAFQEYFSLRVLPEDQLTSLIIEKIHFFLDDLVKQGYIDAIFELGRISYTGEFGYPQDYALALECYLHAGEKGIQQGYANAGYIYYYDRLKTGKPDYENAYKCFSQAAFAGNYNAIFKVSDMLKNGYWIAKNETAAYRILANVYSESKHLYVDEHSFEGCFPEISLRLGLLYREGRGTVKDLSFAMRLFLEARAAMKEKLAKEPDFGDDRIYASIERNVNEMNPLLGISGLDQSDNIDNDFNELMFYMYRKGNKRFKIQLEPVHGRSDKATFSVTIKNEIMFCNNRLNAAGLTDTLVFGITGITLPEGASSLTLKANHMGVNTSHELIIGQGKKIQLLLAHSHLYQLPLNHPLGQDFEAEETNGEFKS